MQKDDCADDFSHDSLHLRELRFFFINQKFKNNKVNARYYGICSEKRRRVTESSLQMPLTMF